jgi:Periplasmic copper-binding protein (NosD)
MRRLLLVAVVSTACFGAVHVGVAYAAACGTVTSSTTLASDCDAPLIIGASGITVDLGGHTVLCSGGGGSIGIDVGSWDAVRIENGFVSSCTTGVLGDGGDSEEFVALTLTANDVGLELSHSVSSTIRNSRVSKSPFTGVLLFETSGIVVQRNSVTDSNLGIFDNGGTGNVLVANSAGSDSVGILLNAQSDVVVRNSTHDGGTGIWVSEPLGGNRLVANRSLGNGLDMRDDAPGCDSNMWKANVFTTANQSCIH